MSPDARSAALLTLVATFTAGCGSSGPSAAPPASIDEAVEWVDTLRLEETEAALVAQPYIRADPAGGWLYWDHQLQQARHYGDDGALLTVLGGPGAGPGEFSRLLGVVRLGDGRFVTLDSRGHLATWTAAGELVQDIAADLSSARALFALPDDRVGVVLRPQQVGDAVSGAVVQVVRPDDGSVETTLASIPLAPEYLAAATTVQPGGPRVHRDSVVVIVLDSAWSIPLQGGTPRGYALRGPSGDSIAPVTPGNAARTSVREWVAASVFVGEADRLSDGSWIVGTYRVRDGQVLHGLRRLDPQGDPLWELPDSPEFLARGPADLLYFADPEGLEPARVLVGRLREP